MTCVSASKNKSTLGWYLLLLLQSASSLPKRTTLFSLLTWTLCDVGGPTSSRTQIVCNFLCLRRLICRRIFPFPGDSSIPRPRHVCPCAQITHVQPESLMIAGAASTSFPRGSYWPNRSLEIRPSAEQVFVRLGFLFSSSQGKSKDKQLFHCGFVLIFFRFFFLTESNQVLLQPQQLLFYRERANGRGGQHLAKLSSRHP